MAMSARHACAAAQPKNGGEGPVAPPRQENRRGLDRTFQGEPEMAGPHHLPLARRRLAPCPVVPDPGARRAAGWPMKADRDASLIVGKCLMCGLGSCIDRAESAQFEALI